MLQMNISIEPLKTKPDKIRSVNAINEIPRLITSKILNKLSGIENVYHPIQYCPKIGLFYITMEV